MAPIKGNPRGKYGHVLQRVLPIFLFTLMVIWILAAYQALSASSSLNENESNVLKDQEKQNQINPHPRAIVSSKNGQSPLVDSIPALEKVSSPSLSSAAHPPPLDITTTKTRSYACPYMSLSDLTPEERHPRAGFRHMVDPPAGGRITLVCCETTQGSWNIAVHTKWAPMGAQRFLDMVRTHYFHRRVPLMRCISHFLCQFGLAGPASQLYHTTLQDDPNWLPEGPDHRQHRMPEPNDNTFVKRFAPGYMAYAGAGPHSRDVQLIVALQANPFLGGGSPWEVPWGELVGNASYTTLSKIYTGYGEHGPSQHLLNSKDPNYLETVQRDFPLLDYVVSCDIVDIEDDPE
jgi:peptidyl-prolyl cis-trans isomerase A (cyclophilin A)